MKKVILSLALVLPFMASAQNNVNAFSGKGKRNSTSSIPILTGDLTINSDARFTENLQPLGSTSSKLHMIEGKTYSLKMDKTHSTMIGVLAQEVRATFPDLVSEDAEGILWVNYQGLIPVLINAVNEQDLKIAALEAQNSEIDELKAMVKALVKKQTQATSGVSAK